jgi:hypothetical protein
MIDTDIVLTTENQAGGTPESKVGGRIDPSDGEET